MNLLEAVEKLMSSSVKDAMAACRENGVTGKAYFMIGVDPEETDTLEIINCDDGAAGAILTLGAILANDWTVENIKEFNKKWSSK